MLKKSMAQTILHLAISLIRDPCGGHVPDSPDQSLEGRDVSLRVQPDSSNNSTHGCLEQGW